MKKLLVLVLFILTLGFYGKETYATTYYGYDVPVTISVNGSIIETENKSIIINGSTYAPIRFVANAININDIEWNNKEKCATLKFNTNTLKLFSDKNYAEFNGEIILTNNTVVARDGRILVPVRFMCEIFDCEVIWDNSIYLADIRKDNIKVNEKLIEKDYTKKDIIWLTRLIEAESSGEPFKGKIAVGNVVMNRVKSDEFPQTVYDVIFDTKYGIQFQPTANGAINNTPSTESVIAGNIALSETNVAGKSLYFLNPKIASNYWIIKNRVFYKSIYNHDFYL